MIHVVAIITAKPGHRAELLERFLAIVPIVHGEKGCMEYRAVIDNDAGLDGARAPAGADTFLVIEKWASVEALDAHSATGHMRQYGKAARDLVAHQLLHVMRDVSA